MINLAACLAGLVVNPIVPIYREAEVGYILKNAGSTILFVPHAFRNYDYAAMALRLQSALPRYGISWWCAAKRADAERTKRCCGRCRGEVLQSAEAADPNAVKLRALYLRHDGNPKGVLHSHNTIMSEIDAVVAFWGSTATTWC